MNLLRHPVRTTNLTRWLALALVLVALGVTIVLNLYIERERTATRERDRLGAQTRVIAENMQQQLAVANHALEEILGELPNWRDAQGKQAAALHLKALANAMPGIRYMSVLDANGTITFSNLPQYVGSNFSQRAYFQTAKQQSNPHTLYVSPPFRSAPGPYVITVTRMVPGPHGEFAGVVIASLDPDYFKTLMASVLYAPDMWDAIAHGDGTLFLMVPGREKLHGMNLAQPGSFFTRHRNSGQESTVMSGQVYSTGEMRMMVQRTVQPAALKMDQPLVVAVSRDLGTVFQPWRRDAMIQLGLYALIVMAATIGLYAYQRHQRKLEQLAAAARAHAHRLGVALDHISAYIYIKDRQRRYVYANRPTLKLFKRTEESLQGCDDACFFPPDAVARLHAVDTRVLEQGEDTAEEIVVESGDGSRRIYWEVKTPVYDDTHPDRIWGLCGISTDITELRQREAALLESEERFHSTFDAAAIGMAQVSLEGRFMQVNEALCRIVGYPRAELQNKTFQEITHPDDLNADLALAKELLEGARDSYQMEKRYFHKDGHVIWILLSGSAVRDAAGKTQYFIAEMQDITERKALLEKLELQAKQDYLTGLGNRRFFLEQGEAELARVQRYGGTLSLFMLDIDHFKNINDTHGHKAGDIVLQKLAQVLRETLRTVDIIGRIGGEEFAILLPETRLQEAISVADRLREIVADTDVILPAGLPLRFTVSIGVATLQQQNINLDILLNQADQALYQAKSAGRNRVRVAEQATVSAD